MFDPHSIGDGITYPILHMDEDTESLLGGENGSLHLDIENNADNGDFLNVSSF